MRAGQVWPDEILRNIRELREQRGASHDACAKAIGLATRSQYTRRESGETPFDAEEIAKLRSFLEASDRWPWVSLADAYTLDRSQRERSAGIVSEHGRSPRLAEYAARRRLELDDEIASEIERRANLDAVPWSDEDLDLLRLIAERARVDAELRRKGGGGLKPPSPASGASPAHPRKRREGGGRK